MRKGKYNFNVLIMVLLIVAIVIIAFGVTYAYFTANITNSETATTITTAAGTMSIVYSGGSAINATNIAPGWTASKTFTITGTNTTTSPASNMYYTCNLVITTNTFTNSAIKYTLTSTNTGSVGALLAGATTATTTALKGIATGASTINLSLKTGGCSVAGPTTSSACTTAGGTWDATLVYSNGYFPTSTSKVHTYVLNLSFPDTGAPQNDDQGKSFQARITTVEKASQTVA